jgi:hypothetical protein
MELDARRLPMLGALNVSHLTKRALLELADGVS